MVAGWKGRLTGGFEPLSWLTDTIHGTPGDTMNLLVACALIFSGIHCLLQAKKNYRKRYGGETRRWPIVYGTPISKRILERLRYTNDDGVQCVEYDCEIKYRYQIKGIEYQGEFLEACGSTYLGPPGSMYLGPQEYMDRRFGGKKLAIFYNPDNPSQSTLCHTTLGTRTRVLMTWISYVLAGPVLITFGIVKLLWPEFVLK